MDPVSNWINQFPVLAVLVGILLFIIYWAIHVAVAIWMHKDGKRRGNPNITWWVFAFIGAGILGMGTLSIIVLVLYAFVRAQYFIQDETSPTRGSSGRFERYYESEGRTVRVRVERVSRDAVLRMMTGPDAGQRVELNIPATTIGSTGDNDIWLRRDENVSARHCRISKDGNLYILEDLNSVSGTTVDRQGDATALIPKQRFRVEDGDVIRLGQTEMKFLSLAR